MISLHPKAIADGLVLIDIGAALCVFPIDRYMRVVQVRDNLLRNRLLASDLEDIRLLARALQQDDRVPLSLGSTLERFRMYLSAKVAEFCEIKKSCGAHTQRLGL